MAQMEVNPGDAKPFEDERKNETVKRCIAKWESGGVNRNTCYLARAEIASDCIRRKGCCSFLTESLLPKCRRVIRQRGSWRKRRSEGLYSSVLFLRLLLV